MGERERTPESDPWDGCLGKSCSEMIIYLNYQFLGITETKIMHQVSIQLHLNANYNAFFAFIAFKAVKTA